MELILKLPDEIHVETLKRNYCNILNISLELGDLSVLETRIKKALLPFIGKSLNPEELTQVAHTLELLVDSVRHISVVSNEIDTVSARGELTYNYIIKLELE